MINVSTGALPPTDRIPESGVGAGDTESVEGLLNSVSPSGIDRGGIVSLGWVLANQKYLFLLEKYHKNFDTISWHELVYDPNNSTLTIAVRWVENMDRKDILYNGFCPDKTFLKSLMRNLKI